MREEEIKMVILYIDYVITSQTDLFGRGTFVVKLANKFVDEYIVDFKSKHRDCCIIGVDVKPSVR